MAKACEHLGDLTAADFPPLRTPGAARSVSKKALAGSSSGTAKRAATSAAATHRPASTRQSTSIRPAIPLCDPQCPGLRGRGATFTRQRGVSGRTPRIPDGLLWPGGGLFSVLQRLSVERITRVQGNSLQNIKNHRGMKMFAVSSALTRHSFLAASAIVSAFGLLLLGSRTVPSAEAQPPVTNPLRPKVGAAAEDQAIRPFRVHIPDEAIIDLRRRIAATRWPDKEIVADHSQGVELETMRKLAPIGRQIMIGASARRN